MNTGNFAITFVTHLLLLSLVVLSQSCRNPSGEKGYLEIANEDEPGEKLIISGRVIGQDRQPIPHAKLFFYQADHQGEYRSTFLGIPGYARLKGALSCDRNGGLTVKTIVPGNYPGETDGKHIHVVASARGYREWKFEFLFEGWISESLRKEIAINNDAIVLDPQQKKNGAWNVQTEIQLSRK